MKRSLKVISSFALITALLTGAKTNSVFASEKQNNKLWEPTFTLEEKFQLKNPYELGNGIKMGGFSALIHLPHDPKNVFYTTSDRGPNGEIIVNGEKRITFPLETFTPSIYKIKAGKNGIEILETIPLKLAFGIDPITGTTLISGVPNLNGLDDVPYAGDAQTRLAYDPYGLDVEGIAYNPKDHTFWLCDEYRPSLVQVRDGTIVQRIVPKGQAGLFADASNIKIVLCKVHWQIQMIKQLKLHVSCA